MATIAPLLPGLAPDLTRQQERREGLKATTVTQLAQRKSRARWRQGILPEAQLTPLVHEEPTPALWDFLTFWYYRVHEDGEHAALWGEVGLSPSKFALAFSQVPMVVLHQANHPWHQVEGLMQVWWLDDIMPQVRARCHCWCHPAYRSLRFSVPLGKHALTYLFDEMAFLMLEGRTPSTHRGALQYIRCLGFRPVMTVPYGEWAWLPNGTHTTTSVVHSILTTDEWQDHAQTSRVEDVRPDVGAEFWAK